MGRQKKNELDAILEQLKRSYATDVDNELEDSLMDAKESDEDAELASVLEKIFASSADKVDNTNDDLEICLENDFEEKAEQVIEDTSTEPTVNDEEIIKDEFGEIEISAIVTEDEPYEMSTDLDSVNSLDKNTAEEEKVDDVLRVMFHQNLENDFSDTVEQPTNSSILDMFTQDDINMEYDEEFDVSQNTEHRPESDESSDEIYDAEAEPAEFDEHYEYHNSSYEKPDGELFDDNYEERVDSEEYEDENTEIAANAIEAKTIILDQKYYTSDILQHPLSDMSFFKPQDDIDFSAYVKNDPNEEDQEVSIVDSLDSSSKIEVNDNDVSLLMKFGYSDEIASSVGNERAQTVIVDKNNQYTPKRHRIVHGFTGKEFSDKGQINDIAKKFKSDKRFLLVISIIISVIAIAMLVSDVLSLLSDHVDDYLSLIIFESLLVICTIILLGKKLYSGVLGIIRFEANAYSMISVIIVEYLVYCFAMLILYNISPVLVYSEVYIALGGYVLLYVSLTVWSEFVDCCREYNTFKIMSDGDVHCVLEKNLGEGVSSHDKKSKNTEYSYGVKRSRLVSGFFRRVIDHNISNVNVVLIVGVIPFVAIIVGIATSMLRDNIALGINAAGYVMFSAFPLSSVLVTSVIEFVNSLKLRKKHSAFIGIDAVDEYSKVGCLGFSDCDAVEITALTEIAPHKNEDNPRKWLNIAQNVFETLGGPLSKVVKSDHVEESNVRHDATINSICENGIDLYFDSSMNVLIGDRHYMLTHNIKVKTDTNLSTAVKGVDRTVIYMAFDGIPHIGFIVTSKIKKSFLEIVELLKQHNIRIMVNSYEPEINDYYFESNNVENIMSVHKPDNYEYSEPSMILDSGIISSTPYDLCNTVIYGQKIMNDRKTAKKARIIQMIVGLLVAGLLVAVSCFTPINPLIAIIQSNALLIFYTAAFLLLIPNIIQVVKLIRRK